MSEQPVYTNSVADFCGVRDSTVVGWRRRGTGPPFTRVGNRVLYFISDVETWLREGQTDPVEAKAEKEAVKEAKAAEPIPAPAQLRRPKGFDSW